MNNELGLRILAEDAQVIAYRPKLARFIGSITAAILLQQVFFRFTQHNNEPFYKFREACSHELYKTGDSWCEELGFSPKQFDGALAVIGTKIEKGVKKSEVMAYQIDGDVFPHTAFQYMVVYWTDSSRVTWYWLNRELLGKCLNSVYLGNSQNGNYLVNQQTAITSLPEKTKQRKQHIPVCVWSADELTISETFASLTSAMVKPHEEASAKMVEQNRKEAQTLITNGVTPETLTAFYRDTYSNGYVPSSLAEIRKKIGAWQKKHAPQPTPASNGNSYADAMVTSIQQQYKEKGLMS